ncbi:MAG: transposase [Rhodoplanes sp.]
MIERLCRRDAGYRFIVGDEAPDHTVIARFRQRHAGRMKSVFLQVLELCREAGLIRLGSCLARCRGEWQLDAAVHNLRKLHRVQ